VVARAVLQALTAPKPRTRHPVGADSTILTWMPRLLPTRWLDQIRFRIFGQPRSLGAMPMAPERLQVAQSRPLSSGEDITNNLINQGMTIAQVEDILDEPARKSLETTIMSGAKGRLSAAHSPPV
jgi:hypothetical protein